MVRTIDLASPKLFSEACVVLLLPLLVVAHVPRGHTHNQSAGQGSLRQVLQGRPAVLAIGRRAHATGGAGRATNTGHGDSARVVEASAGGGTCDATTSMVAKCRLASGAFHIRVLRVAFFFSYVYQSPLFMQVVRSLPRAMHSDDLRVGAAELKWRWEFVLTDSFEDLAEHIQARTCLLSTLPHHDGMEPSARSLLIQNYGPCHSSFIYFIIMCVFFCWGGACYR